MRRKNNKTMKRILTTLFALVALMATAQAAEVPLLGNVYARQTTLLNGDWNYIVDVQEEGYYDYRMNVSRWGFFKRRKAVILRGNSVVQEELPYLKPPI